MKFSTKCALAALALLIGGAAQANAGFVNGSFETGNLSGWGGTATTDGFGLNPFGTSEGSGMDGTHWMWLAGRDIAGRTLSQTLTGLTSGATYGVDFIMASEYVASDRLKISVDGGAFTTFTAPPRIGTFWDNWQAEEFTFTASGTSATILFSSFGLNSNAFDVGLDNVTLREIANPNTAAVPEPGTLVVWSLMAGVFGVGRLRKRFVPAATAS